ncbi:hypothetical protein QAD02_001002 [Eretmocerus hayati]|uniref:Uncharacterized protein n=1 Tax=Eretmocerus hayati TaxID=131215 RepID=A0ACC2NF07_9HYME|nr:hypothetical protein QAD02_001002 [Eretmocerus hayati]
MKSISQTQQQQQLRPVPSSIGKQIYHQQESIIMSKDNKSSTELKDSPTNVDHTPSVSNYYVNRKIDRSKTENIKLMGKVRATCEFCGKCFSHVGDANKHRRKHTGERPYTCKICLYSFPHASNLRRHERSHSSDPRPFQCPNCARGFSRKDKLAQHVARRCCITADISEVN